MLRGQNGLRQGLHLGGMGLQDIQDQGETIAENDQDTPDGSGTAPFERLVWLTLGAYDLSFWLPMKSGSSMIPRMATSSSYRGVLR